MGSWSLSICLHDRVAESVDSGIGSASHCGYRGLRVIMNTTGHPVFAVISGMLIEPVYFQRLKPAEFIFDINQYLHNMFIYN